MSPRTLAFAVLASVGLAVPVEAQVLDLPEVDIGMVESIDKPAAVTTVDRIVDCMVGLPGGLELLKEAFTGELTGLIRPRCIHSPGQEGSAWGSANKIAFYWQLALLGSHQIMEIYDWGTQMLDQWTGTWNLLRSAITGFDPTSVSRTAYRLSYTSRYIRNRALRAERAFNDDPWRGRRAAALHEMVMTRAREGLELARQLEEHAVQLSDRGATLQQRLGGRDFQWRIVGGLGGSAPPTTDLPRSLDPDRYESAYQAIYDSQPASRTGRPLRTASEVSEGASADCGIPASEQSDPAVLWHQAEVIASGAELGARGIQAEGRVTAESIRALRAAEYARAIAEREHFHARAMSNF